STPLIRVFLRSLRDIGFNQKRVVIVGAGPLGKRAARAMLEQTWAGLNPVGFFDDKQSLVGQTDRGVEVLGPISQLASHIEERRNEGRPIDQAWIALPLTQNKRIAEIQTSLQDTSTDVYFVPDLFGFDLASYRVDEIVGLPVMNMSAKNVHGVKALVKRIEDIFLSSILLILLSPLLLILAGLVKISSPGPILFKQRRYGQHGREILVWKFRSMTVADDGDSIVQAKRNDERVTKVGKWLRKLSLDELPQLFNVLQGSMSLVGPRPHAVAHNELYRKEVPGYMIRHQIRPGITGWAQVNGCRGETSKLSDMEERIRYDIDYIRNWSILLDIRILFRTIRVVLKSADVY
ncbi:MAG: undecaprenyl-phosphate glucose phosphotransferase, partial [Arenicella sp.]|nr:undecaprenyl-phosphate glucose phosphotransferase [Arenicella sp.]